MDKYLTKPTYPTGSLDFLDRLKRKTSPKTPAPVASVKLRIAICGAGIGGLAAAIALARTGHDVTVFEAASKLGEIGAGLQIPPNSCKYLLEWGLAAHLSTSTVYPSHIYTRRWQDGSLIGDLKLIPEFEDRYGAPYMQMHRADLHHALVKVALEKGAKIRTGCRVIDYDFEAPTMMLEGGEVVTADLIIGADGIKSVGRQKLTGRKTPAVTISGYAAYRATIPVSVLCNNSDTSRLVEQPIQNLWIGPDRHAMTYTISNNTVFNFVLVHPESADPSTWDPSTYLDDIRENHFRDWDPTLRKLLSHIKTATKWPLNISDPLENWMSPSGRFVLIGDAAHSMVPWMAQGAAMAVEDAAALSASLLHLPLPTKDNPLSTLLPAALTLFAGSRLPRTSSMQQASLLNGYLWHLHDGLEQEARDEAARPEVDGAGFVTSSMQWSDPVTQRWCYGFDAVGEVGRVAGLRVRREGKL